MLMTAGIIGPAHGLRGEVMIDVRSDDPQLWEPGARMLLNEDEHTLTIRSVRTHKGRLLVSFEGVNSRDGAQSLRGGRLLVEEHSEDDAWYPHELKGAQVYTPESEILGEVVGLRFGAAQDHLVVKTERGSVLVPFVHAIVPKVDASSRRITVDPPPGLFDDRVVDAKDGGRR